MKTVVQFPKQAKVGLTDCGEPGLDRRAVVESEDDLAFVEVILEALLDAVLDELDLVCRWLWTRWPKELFLETTTAVGFWGRGSGRFCFFFEGSRTCFCG